MRRTWRTTRLLACAAGLAMGLAGLAGRARVGIKIPEHYSRRLEAGQAAQAGQAGQAEAP